MKRCYADGPECRPPLVRHHIVKQQRIRAVWRSLMAAKRRGGPNPWSVTKAVADPRNLIWTCQSHHHEDVPVPLPDGFWSFVDEYGLHGQLPRHLRGHDEVVNQRTGERFRVTTVSGQEWSA